MSLNHVSIEGLEGIKDSEKLSTNQSVHKSILLLLIHLHELCYHEHMLDISLPSTEFETKIDVNVANGCNQNETCEAVDIDLQ